VTKETYRELEALAVEAVKRGFIFQDEAALSSGVYVLTVLESMRLPSQRYVPADEAMNG
jgi:hypothetical protein